ncbi:MAG: Tim44/TimA family putative adaptor protein [Holosporales bacterium]|jgi:predicted lipid-binding transport protein (Tim44 family)|nr:Tim44/TimA family putative adaptor protein [Holosporales bacterium]
MGTLVFAVLTCFLLLQLHAILGRDVGHRPSSKHQKNIRNMFKSTVNISKSNKSKPIAVATEHVSSSFFKAYPAFNQTAFLKGSEAAFTFIQKAYASRDRAGLKKLLTAELFQAFDKSLTEQEQRGECMESSFLEIRSSVLKNTRVHTGALYASVEFVSDQCFVLKNAQGAILAGSAELIRTVTDTWVFTRQTASSSSKWYLAETVSAERASP